jgi:aminopeptidase-like protein
MPNARDSELPWLAECPVRETADEVAAYFDRLWPLLRSITGEGVRRTHDILGELVPLERIEIPSGTQCFDWTAPKEWACREAYVIGPDGRRLLDVRQNTLHLVNYSIAFRGVLSRAELDEHLYSLPEMPAAIPYVTSYYAPRWGFCLPHAMRTSLPDGQYQVVVDCEHFDGSLTLSQAVLPGEEADEVLISTYTCHPSLANNELSGPLLAAFLYRRLAAIEHRRLTFRFVWLPETIGSLAYLSRYGGHFCRRLVAGYVASCVGDRGPLTYKRSRRGDSAADRAALYALRRLAGDSLRVLDFDPSGSDERQYCSPGFDLPVGVIARSIFGTYPEYHTSLDNRDFISFDSLVESVDAYLAVLGALDANATYCRTAPYGEPQLGRYGLYPTLGGPTVRDETLAALRWLLNLADGKHDLLTMAERSRVSLAALAEAAQRCLAAGLIERVASDHG